VKVYFSSNCSKFKQTSFWVQCYNCYITATTPFFQSQKVIAPNWMQNFWANFLSIFCTGIVFIMSIVMHFRPKSWTKEKMISVSLGVTCLLFLATAFIGIVIDQTHSSSKTIRSVVAWFYHQAAIWVYNQKRLDR